MILATSAIRERLENGEIFREGTWEDSCIKEASYTLRVADDGMMIDGKAYSPGNKFPEASIRIKPGTFAILSTVERLFMPDNLVGHQGIRFNWAARGLTGLMGIQVDPLYGTQYEDERLYLRFANLGNQDIYIQPGDAVFNIEFERVEGDAASTSRPRMWNRVLELVQTQEHADWSYATRIEVDMKSEAARIEAAMQSELDIVRQGPEAVVMIGVFLVAATLLGVTLTLLFPFRDTPTASVPDWVTGWGWMLMLIFIGIASLTTAGIGLAIVYRFLRRSDSM